MKNNNTESQIEIMRSKNEKEMKKASGEETHHWARSMIFPTQGIYIEEFF